MFRIESDDAYFHKIREKSMVELARQIANTEDKIERYEYQIEKHKWLMEKTTRDVLKLEKQKEEIENKRSESEVSFDLTRSLRVLTGTRDEKNDYEISQLKREINDKKKKLRLLKTDLQRGEKRVRYLEKKLYDLKRMKEGDSFDKNE